MKHFLDLPNDSNKIVRQNYASSADAKLGSKRLVIVTDIIDRHTFFEVECGCIKNTYGTIEEAIRAYNDV